MVKLYIKDYGRRFQNSGYGQLARSIILALHRHSRHTLVLSGRKDAVFSEGIPNQEEFRSIEHSDKPEELVDAVLHVTSPTELGVSNLPTIVYTQNALGGVISEWGRYLSAADTVVVPGEFDRPFFEAQGLHVEVCPQMVDYTFFKPMPKYRQEGDDLKSFLFVGSFSFRKGVDMTTDVFNIAFSDGAPVHIDLHCFSGLEGQGLNLLIDIAKKLPSNVKLTADNRPLTLPWMRRKINRFDGVFTFSRGEGWCMPLWEALLSGIPVVAPASTAMLEWLPEKGVSLFETVEKRVCDISAEFGQSFKRKYGEDHIKYYEGEAEKAAAAFRNVYDNLDSFQLEARDGREYILDKFNYHNIARRLSEIVESTIEKKR